VKIKFMPETRNAVIYARFSSHNQREASIEQQVEWCKALAAKYGLEIIAVYSDKAITGRTDNRPEFQRMLADAKAGKFGYVLSWKSNRIGRDMLDAMKNDKLLLEYGVRCLYVEEDFEDNAAGRFALRNMMNVNQFYSESMAEDVRRGMMDNASKCMVNGRIPYGYRKGKDGRYEIVPEAAEVVREIFQKVIDGWNHIDIIDDLNNRGIKNQYGRAWQRTAFGKLLRMEQYIGVYKFAEVRIEGGVPPILDKQTFQEVQRILETKPNPRGRRRDVADYILTGKLFCGHCGEAMVGICGTSRNGDKHYYYLCQGKHQHRCDKKNERKEQIEQAVINAIKKFIMDDETIDWIVAGYKKFIEDLRQESAVSAMEAELAEVNKAIANLMKAIEAGIITETTKERLFELEGQKKQLTFTIETERALLQDIPEEKIRFTIERYRNTNLNDRDYQRELIRSFVKAVYVYDDYLRIVVSRGTDEDIMVPFKDVDSLDEGGNCVCISDTKPHQKF
jgi:DNA invertase Pin-like site-specific DNA recombinase